jgi:hypothetical protein
MIQNKHPPADAASCAVSIEQGDIKPNNPVPKTHSWHLRASPHRALFRVPSTPVRSTEPPSVSRPVGDDRWRNGGPDGPLKMSGIF